MARSAGLHDALAGPFPGQAAYAVSMALPGALRRCSSTPAKRCTCWSCAAPPQGHPSYRRIALEMHRLIAEQAGHRAVAAAMRHLTQEAPALERLESERRAEVQTDRPNPLPEVEVLSRQVEVCCPRPVVMVYGGARRRGRPGGSMARATHRLPTGAGPRPAAGIASWRGRWSRWLAVPRVPGAEHEVRPGETLTSIARRYGVSVAELADSTSWRTPITSWSAPACTSRPWLPRRDRLLRRQRSPRRRSPSPRGSGTRRPACSTARPGSSACRPLSSWP